MDWQREQELKERFQKQFENTVKALYPSQYVDLYGYRRQLDELALLTGYDEKVVGVAIAKQHIMEEGILIVTNARLVFMDHYQTKETFTYDHILTIKHEAKSLSRYSGTITVLTTGLRFRQGDTVVFDNLDKERSQGLAEYVRACIANPAAEKSRAQLVTERIREFYPDIDVFEYKGELERLAEMISPNESEERVERVAKQGGPTEGMLIATNARLFFSKDSSLLASLVSGLRRRDLGYIRYDAIRSIQHSAKLLSRYSGRITLEKTGFERVVFAELDKGRSLELAEYIKTCIDSLRATK